MTKHKLPKTLKDLIKQGEEDGFLAQDDIFLIYAEPEKHLEDIDSFFDRNNGRTVRSFTKKTPFKFWL